MPICPTCREHYLGDETFCPRDGTALQAAQSDPLIGQILGGRYLVEVRIGEGGMGTVYRARQQSLDRAVAVKLLRRDLVGDDAAMVRFQREARAASSLDHPNCTKVLDFGQTTDGLLFLVMELLTGEGLGQVLLRGPLPVLRALGIMRHVALALGHAHAHSIIHRDLKPDNVYLCPADVVKVLDFGLCKRVSDVEAGVTQAGVVFGTPEYMSPEQAEAKPLDARSDLYSLGAVLFRAVTGDLPFHASTYVGLLTQHISALPPVPSSVRPELGIPPAVDELVLSLLEKDPANRPPTANAVAEELARVIGELESARTGENAAPIAAGVGPYGSGRVAGVPPAVAAGASAPYGSGRVAGVPPAVAGAPSGPSATSPVSERLAPSASGPAAGAGLAASSASVSVSAVPRAPRTPIVLAILLLAIGGAGLVAWQEGWLQGRGSGAVAHAADASTAAPASAPAPTVVAASSGSLAVAAPAVASAPLHPSPGAAKAAPAATKAATAAAPTGARKPPRDTKIARAPQQDAGVPPPPPPPPPPVKVLPPAPQQDAGVAPGRAQVEEQVTVSLLKARVALIRGDLEGALRELEAARRLRENAAVHVGFAEVYARQGNTLRALAHWQKAVNLSPRDPTLRVRFAEALARAGEVEEACTAVRAALAIRPQHARGMALHGRLGCAER